MAANMSQNLGLAQSSILGEQLAAIAPSIGVKMPQSSQPSFPEGVGPIIDIPSKESPLTEIQGYDPSMENQSWGLYTDLQSARDVKNLKMSPLESICECNKNQTDPSALNTQCSMLTEYNCKRIGCCVYTSSNKCVAGDRTGPTAEYASNIDYYYYKNKCYGDKCPQKKCR